MQSNTTVSHLIGMGIFSHLNIRLHALPYEKVLKYSQNEYITLDDRDLGLLNSKFVAIGEH